MTTDLKNSVLLVKLSLKIDWTSKYQQKIAGSSMRNNFKPLGLEER